MSPLSPRGLSLPRTPHSTQVPPSNPTPVPQSAGPPKLHTSDMSSAHNRLASPPSLPIPYHSRETKLSKTRNPSSTLHTTSALPPRKASLRQPAFSSASRTNTKRHHFRATPQGDVLISADLSLHNATLVPPGNQLSSLHLSSLAQSFPPGTKLSLSAIPPNVIDHQRRNEPPPTPRDDPIDSDRPPTLGSNRSTCIGPRESRRCHRRSRGASGP
jgi:hypothetical protein